MKNSTPHRKIKTQFIIISIAFTIPIVMLFYFMLRFNNTNIDFTKDEIIGVEKIEKIFNEFHLKPSAYNARFLQDISSIGDSSKLILDPDLDSYYMMDTVIIRLPRILTYINEMKHDKKELTSNEVLRILLAKELFEFNASTKKVFNEENIKVAKVITLHSSEYQSSIELFKKSIMSIINKSDNIDLEAAYQSSFNILILHNVVLKEFLNKRVEKLEHERMLAITITAILWIMCLLFVIFTCKQFILVIDKFADELTEKNAQILNSSKLASLGEMSAGIAHEINNPLSIISSMVELLPEFKNNTELYESKIKIIQKSVIRIKKIISGVTKVSRSGNETTFSKHSLNGIVNEVMTLTIGKSKSNGTPVTFESNGDYYINCDEVAIEQVTINLINNAIDAVQSLSEKWVEISLSESNSLISLKIIDSGKGIPKEIAKKLFDPFFTTKEAGKGTGLGLSITKAILVEHGASIQILEESPNTCFEILFPKTLS